MKVKVTKDTLLLHNNKAYKAGDELEMEGDRLEASLNAGHVEEVKSSKKATKKEKK